MGYIYGKFEGAETSKNRFSNRVIRYRTEILKTKMYDIFSRNTRNLNTGTCVSDLETNIFKIQTRQIF